MSFWKTEIQRFKPGVRSKYVEEVETLWELAGYIKNTPNKYIKVFDELREAKRKGDEKLRSEIKMNSLPFHTPSAFIKKGGKRAYEDIERFNPVALIEFDGIGLKEALKLKDVVFYSMPSCAIAWVSPSGDGAKFLFRIPAVKSVEEYKVYWNGLAYIFQDIKGFDRSNVNCILPLFISYDRKAKIRKKPTVFTGRGFYESEFKELTKEERDEILSNAQDIPKKIQLREMKSIKRSFESIEDNGFPQVRSLSIVSGGLFAGGVGGSEEKWKDFLEGLIRSNHYLSNSGGENKLNTYINTMRSAFNIGTKSPKIPKGV